jgi:thioredoxin 1
MISELKTVDQFKKLSGKKKCILDFYSDNCAPCKRVDSELKQYGDVLGDIFKVNVEKDGMEELASRFAVRSLPTLIFMKENLPMIVVSAFIPEEIKKAVTEYSKW